jgi:uncharacterized membrane protein YccC
VLPAAIIPLPPQRRARVRVFVVGVLAGLSLLIGGVLSHLPTLLTAALLAIAVLGAAVLASTARYGMVVLALCAPLVAAGLSYTDYASAVGTFLLLSAGAAYAWIVSLAWPAREAAERARPQLPDRPAMVGYGQRMGVAAAIGYLVAVSLGLDHPGWAPAACLLVARPAPDLLKTRGIGRVASVVVGALAAALLLAVSPPFAVYSILVLVVLGCATGTTGSRWYISSAFTTFFVYLMLVYGAPEEAAPKFHERVGETVLGVVLAYLFAWLLPSWRRHG